MLPAYLTSPAAVATDVKTDTCVTFFVLGECVSWISPLGKESYVRAGKGAKMSEIRLVNLA